jgi:hypothetical protein
MTMDLGTIVPGQPHANRAGTTLSTLAIRWRHSRRLLLTLSLTVRNRQLAGARIGGDPVAVTEGTIEARSSHREGNSQ